MKKIKEISNIVVILFEIICIIFLILNSICDFVSMDKKLFIAIILILLVIDAYRNKILKNTESETLQLPDRVNINTFKEYLMESNNYNYKIDNTYNMEIYIEKSLKSIELVFMKGIKDLRLDDENINKVFDMYINRIQEDKKKFKKIYIIVELENIEEVETEYIFNKICLKPVLYHRAGYSDEVGSFVIPIIYDKNKNLFSFGKCTRHVLFFEKQKELFISAIEYLIDK